MGGWQVDGAHRSGRRVAVRLVALVVLATLGMAPVGGNRVAVAQPDGPKDVILATTTSTQDSGLLDVLGPLFEERTGFNLKPIAVGSGAALKLGEEGEADVLLAHSPAAEEAFMDAGFGLEREVVMYNDFVIVGPVEDPAGIAGEASAVGALDAIAETGAPFVSRGDDSGTHALELRLWREAGVEPGGSWYQESGTGMGDTLNITNERQGYTISDRGTFLSLRERLDLAVLVEGAPELLNVYHVITVNPANGPRVNVAGGRAFFDFLLEAETQRVIGEFGVERFGEPLFVPCARNSCGLGEEATPVASPEATPGT